jgi:N-acetyltransferase
MLVCKGQEEDERLHKKVCSKFILDQSKCLEPIKYKSVKDERVVERVGLHSKIICIRPSDSKLLIKKANKIRDLVEAELGCSALPEEKKQNQICYIYVEDDSILGAIIVQHIKSAYRILLEEKSQPSGGLMAMEDDKDGKMTRRIAEEAMTCCDTTKSIPATCGVSRIWVHKEHRRKKIAWKLLDAVRKSFIYGYVIPKEQIAFSQPTTEGKLFAMNYTGTKEFLVFVE